MNHKLNGNIFLQGMTTQLPSKAALSVLDRRARASLQFCSNVGPAAFAMFLEMLPPADRQLFVGWTMPVTRCCANALSGCQHDVSWIYVRQLAILQ